MANASQVRSQSSVKLYDLSDPKQRAQWEQQWLLRGRGIVLQPMPPQRPRTVSLSVVSPS
jgi:hypothetical protein